MYPVDIWLSANTSNYWTQIEFTDRKGERRSRIVSKERIATINSNTLQGLIEAIGILQVSCMVDVHTESDYLISAIRNGWLQTWKASGWKTAKEKPVKNMEQWKQLERELSRHSIKMTKRRQ